MELKHLVIREVMKEEEKPAVVADRGGVVTSSTDIASQMVESLNNALARRSTLTHGSFNQENPAGYPFIDAFSQYLESEQTSDAFSTLCDTGLAQLTAAIDAPSARSATGGYVVFSHYTLERYEFLLVALVRNRATISLGDDLTPQQINQLDLDKLHQAAKVNITNFRKGKESYLSFTGTKETGSVTHYFATAFGCTDVVPSKKSTSDLLQAAKDFCTEHGMYDEREQVVEDVVSYLNRQRSEKLTANLPEVEQIFDQYIPPEQAEELSGSFSRFANGERYQVSHEFQPHTHTLNNLTKLKLKSDNWQADLSKKSIGTPGTGNDIEFDEENKQLVIKRLSTRVIEQLRKALAQEE
ncbi:nucleoid-associated protein [Neptunomonas marina]|uniref:Nucleoid-associated protein n=1 Tax=Neptunomonas marina TaxID=1815562 RepID=A0A437Q9C6_9GAMM|nr:nucleoid-associated protein [Neptunomonas marina]RVU31115.1 nucleoid-associated protein [Neptunomonas marina]